MHKPIRTWRRLWRRRCACGQKWPHPTDPPAEGMPIDDGTEATYTRLRMNTPGWYEQTTAAYPVNGPLLTRGQAARSNDPRWPT